MSDRSERAVRAFSGGLNCAQAVAGVFAEDYGLDEAVVEKLVCGFGGGISHTGRSCGAVNGAIFILGLARGTSVPGDREGKELCYTSVREFLRRFGECHGSVDCTDLVGFDLSDPRGLDAARVAGVFSEKCTLYVRDAVEILEDLLKES